MDRDQETHLGDGLYASFDGWMVTLRAPRFEGDHYVYLEPGVLAEFKRFIDRLDDRAAPSEEQFKERKP